MRQKELRLALICYGGISLAVYMHGITKEIWRLAKASRSFHEGNNSSTGTQGVYQSLLALIEDKAGLRLRILTDIIAGASAGGINGVFLAQAIATGQSLEPLTAMWLDSADVDTLIDPDARPWSRFSKIWAAPIAWVATGKPGGAVERTVDETARDEVRAKLSSFVRARWFAPPFGGTGFTELLLNALDAMAEAPAGPALLPEGQPLDLFVTVTDFHGHPERLQLHLPREAVETEHRLTISFTDDGRSPRTIGDAAELAFAARATASFPGAFPPFSVAELDRVLERRERSWPGRADFLKRILPRQFAAGMADRAVLIDGSVLANAPFRPAMEALRDRPARREVDRRFVYIDPKPGRQSIRFGGHEDDETLPGFFRTIFGALSDIPREQPIRDNLESIARRSERIARMRRIVDAIRPEVETTIERLFGHTFFLDRPTASRLAVWRDKAQDAAARQAGYAYASYGHLKLERVIEEIAILLCDLVGSDQNSLPKLRDIVRRAAAAHGLDNDGAIAAGGASAEAIAFFRAHDLGFRIRRLRFLARQIGEIEQAESCPLDLAEEARNAIYAMLSLYLDRETGAFYGPAMIDAARKAGREPANTLDRLAEARDLAAIDAMADDRLAAAFSALPRAERRTMLLAYLGYPFYDIATLPLTQSEGQFEFETIKVDRISPDDATAIREGGAEATLKGIQFNSFGAFFSRAYRENDYLWGRLHGAERLIDIVVSALPEGTRLPPGRITTLKRQAFRSILAEERNRLTAIPELFETLENEVG
ncbi:patatin-like protein [Flavisphingomonas formosensis]|uniref:patatin-like protein n=1 Tax=Flavisphingomonas formosensis TaxID=861534 RepID=UPI0012FA34F4|nr:patatin-like protein [Sphingomonas formosensis]